MRTLARGREPASALRIVVTWGTPIALGLLLAQSSCRPSNVNGAISGLIAPPSVSVVTTDVASGSSLARAQGPSSFPPDADYFLDPLDEYVYDRALERLETVNEILCLIGQARPADFVNSGLYRAQIDTSLCGASDAGVNEPGSATAIEEWIVRSHRPGPAAPQLVDFWIPRMKGGPSGALSTLYAQATVHVAPDDANPFGVFTMDFAGADPGGAASDPNFCGNLATSHPLSGTLGYLFFDLNGDPAVLPPPGSEYYETSINVEIAVDGATGVARVVTDRRFNDPFLGDQGLQTSDDRIAFDATTLVRSRDGGPAAAFSRTSFTACNVRYNLYDNAQSTGARVALNTGVPIVLANGTHAFLDYFGVHAPPGTMLLDGDPVNREDGGVLDPAPLTLRVARGRLIENRRNATPLSAIVGEVFEWDEPFQGFGPVRYRLLWDGVNFVAFEQFDFALGAWLPITPFNVDVSTYGVLRMRSQRYGGNVSYTDGAVEIAWYTEKVASGDPNLFGTQGQVALFGYFDCPRPLVPTVDAEAGFLFLPPPPSVAQPHVFEFRQSDHSLWHDDLKGNVLPAGLAPGAVPQSGPAVLGYRSGPLVTDPTGLSSMLEIFDQPLFYSWETGANPFNLWAGLEDPATGALVQLDAPIQFAYRHSTANDLNGDPTHDGQEFLLEYRGDGQLYGIPYRPFDTDGDGFPDHDVPFFSIADGVALGPTGVEFVVKATRRELLLQRVSIVPPGLDPSLADALVLPDGSRYVTPEIGPVPLVTSPPAVVGGEIQGLRR